MKSFTDYKNREEQNTIIADGGIQATSYRETGKSRKLGNYHARANNPAVWATLAAQMDTR